MLSSAGELSSKNFGDIANSVSINSIEFTSNFSASPRFYAFSTISDSLNYSRDADNIDAKPVRKSNTESLDLKSIMDFVFNRLIHEDFGYGDTPELKYVVEGIFKKDKNKAQMAFINMLSMKVFASDHYVIEKFFALLMSMDDSYINDIAMVIVTVFSAHADQSAAEGALAMLDKFGSDVNALNVARNIRDFDYQFLNDYKRVVIKNLSRFEK
ncbi:hypothetical protein [Plesiomonas shigelloides]|uniref:hypothetical protein n=1 Tax=Plesiomonas shigelloides TaxID=703 RepID=UPI0032600370